VAIVAFDILFINALRVRLFCIVGCVNWCKLFNIC
jgi:hypothetical protein